MFKSFFKKPYNWLFGPKYKRTTANCPCYDKSGNFIGWFSRSVAVITVAFIREDDKVYVLASKRGKGTPDPEFVGAWNVCCGYLDFNETCKDAAIRETFEETGIKIPKSTIFFDSINDNPQKDKRQNVSIRYYAVLDGAKKDYETLFSHKNNEKNEVEDIKFIKLEDVVNYRWAFNHKELIGAIYQKNKSMI